MGNNRTPTETNRRALLGAIGGSMGAVAIGANSISASQNCGISEGWGNYDEVGYEFDMSDADATVEEGYYGLYDYAHELRSNFIYGGAEYYDPRGKWLHAFSFGGHVTTQRKNVGAPDSEYEEYGNLNGHLIEAENKDPSVCALAAIEHPEWLGATPPAPGDETSYEYADRAFTVATGVLSFAASSTLLAASATALGITSALTGSSQSSGGGSAHAFGWEYTDADEWPCEAAHFVCPNAWSNDGETEAAIEVRNRAAQQKGGGFVEETFWVNVDADPGDDPGCQPGEPCPTEERKAPKPGTDEYLEYLEKSDVAKKIDPQASILGNVTDVETDGAIYRATNPRVVGGKGPHPKSRP